MRRAVRIRLRHPPLSLHPRGFSAGFAENPRILGPICISRGTRDRRARATLRGFGQFISVSNFAGAARKRGPSYGLYGRAGVISAPLTGVASFEILSGV